VGFDSELELSDVFSGDAFVVEFEEFFTDDEWVDHVELYWENHLTVSVEFF